MRAVKNAKLQLAALIAADVVLLWIVSSVLRGKGLLAFAAGLGLLALATWRARGTPRLLFLCSFVLLLAAGGLLATDTVLRLYPGLLSGHAANAVYGGYHDEPDGIYDHDDHLGCVQRPGFARRMYWNGRWWRHETNADGYRGPRRVSADAVFLGDSMIYGHGVEADETVPARFEAATGATAANLGQQGTCLVQALMLLQSRGAALRPRVVFVCAHPNDLADASYWYEPGELRRFVAEDAYLPYARPEFRGGGGPFGFWLRHVSLPLATGRAVRALAASRRAPAAAPSMRAAWVPAAADVEAPFPPTEASAALGWNVQQRAIVRLKRACDAMGARMVVFDLGYPTALSRAVEEVSRGAGAEYDAIGRHILARALAGEEMYQRDDGHWTPQAGDVIARALAARLPPSPRRVP